MRGIEVRITRAWWYDGLRFARKEFPQPDHGEGVEAAVFVELIVDLGFAFWAGFRVDSFLVGGDGHVAVLDAFEVAIGEIRADGW